MRLLFITVTFLYSILSANAQWTDISIPVYSGIKDIHFKQNNGFAITGYQSLGTSAQVFKTIDHGQNWTEVSPDFMSIVSPNGVSEWAEYGENLTLTFTGEEIHFFNASEGLLSITVLVEINSSTPSGLSFSSTLKTINGGMSWYEVQNTNDVTGFTQFIGLNDSSVIVHRHGDIFRSYDKGENWTEIFDYSYGWSFDFDHIVLGPDNLLYAGVNEGGFNNTGKTMVSTDEGITWTEVFESFPEYQYRPDIAFSDNGHILMRASTGGYMNQAVTFVSTDNGMTWQGPSTSVSQFEYTQGQWFGLGGDGILESTDGISWNPSLTLTGSLEKLKTYDDNAYVCGWDGLIYTNFNFENIGVKEINSDEINIYPNPIASNNNLIIETENHLDGIIQISNLYGQTLNSLRINQKQITIDFSYPPGVYFARINSHKGIYTERIIVN